MNRGERTARYALGTATNRITIENLYKYGGSVWAVIYLALGLLEAGTFPGAINVLLDVYIMKLFGWPWDELLLANTLPGLIRSHVQTWVAGWVVASLRYGVYS